MATITIRPDADILTQWWYPAVPPHYINVNDGITYPTNPTGTSHRISADGYIGEDNNQYDSFTFGNTPANVDVVTQIKIYLFGQIDADGTTNYPEVSYDIGSGWSGDYECSSFPKNNTIGTGNGAWHTITVSGLSWTKAQIDAIQVRIRADVPDGGKGILAMNAVFAMQILVTYTPTAPAGYGHDYMGVLAANIGSVNGVPTANIASIKGV